MPHDTPNHEARPPEDESAFDSADVAETSPDADVVDDYRGPVSTDSTGRPAAEQAADDAEIANHDPGDDEAPHHDEAEQGRQEAAEATGRQTVARTVDQPKPAADTGEPGEDDDVDTGSAPSGAKGGTSAQDEEGPVTDAGSGAEEEEPSEITEPATGTEPPTDDGKEPRHAGDDEVDDADPEGPTVDDDDEVKDDGDEEPRGAEGEKDMEDADEWEKDVAAREHAARENGQRDQPAKTTNGKLRQMEEDGTDIDLDEIEELLTTMDPDAAVSARGRQLEEDDDSWMNGRDAAGSGTSVDIEEGNHDEDARETPDGEAIAEVRHIGRDRQAEDGTYIPAQPRWDEAFIQAARDMGFVAETERFLANEQPEQLRPDNDKLADVVPINFGTGQQTVTRSDSNLGGGGAEVDERFLGTPEGGKNYPPELIAAMDFLMEHVGGPTGEAAALLLADEFEGTGRIPLGLPQEVYEKIGEELERRVAGD